MIKCQTHAGLFLWEAVRMGVAITITRTQLFEAVTGLSRLTYMFLGVLHRVRPYSMHYSSCRRRLEGGGIFFIGGISDSGPCLLGWPVALLRWHTAAAPGMIWTAMASYSSPAHGMLMLWLWLTLLLEKWGLHFGSIYDFVISSNLFNWYVFFSPI